MKVSGVRLVDRNAVYGSHACACTHRHRRCHPKAYRSPHGGGYVWKFDRNERNEISVRSYMTDGSCSSCRAAFVFKRTKSGITRDTDDMYAVSELAVDRVNAVNVGTRAVDGFDSNLPLYPFATVIAEASGVRQLSR